MYDLTLSEGLKPVARKDGGLDVVTASGDVTFTAPAPVAADTNGDVAPAAPIGLARDGEGWTLSVGLDKTWLASKARTYPVTLDPSFALGASQDCFLDQQDATTSFCGSGELWAGRAGAGHNHTALTQFNVAGTVPAGSHIQRASLVLWPLYQTAPGNPKTLAAREVTEGWDNSATWNKRNASTNWGTAGGSLGGTDLATAALPGTFSAWTVTDTVADWIAKTKTNTGFAITDNGSSVNNAQVYASADWGTSSKWPSLEIEYQYQVGALGRYTIDREQITDRSSVGVNVAGGNLLLESSDLQVDGTGLSLGINHYYNSFEPWDGQLGMTGFRINYGEDIKLFDCDQQGTGDKCLIGPSGFRARFKKVGSTWKTPPGIGDVKLTQQTTGGLKFELTDNKSGTVYEFFNSSFAFNSAIRDKNGNRIEIENNGTLGNISKITDTHGRQYPVTLNSAGYVTKIETPTGGIAWQYGYNASNFLTSVTDPENKVTTYGYHPTTNRLDSITDPRGNQTLIVYDAQGRVSSVTRKVDGTTTNDVTTTYAYSAPDGTWCKEPVTSLAAAGAAGVTTITDPRGKQTKYCWDAQGKVLKARDALGRDTATKFTPSGNAQELSSNAASTSSPYSTSSYTYSNNDDPNGTLDSITSPSGEKSIFAYNGTGGNGVYNAQLKQSKDEQGNLTKYTYDANSNPLTIESSRASVSGGAPSLGATLEWDSLGRLKSSTDKAGQKTTYWYDATSKDLIEVRPHDSTIIGSTLLQTDGLSRVTQSKDGRTGQWVNYTYDKLGRQLTAPDSDSENTTVTYDGNGNVLTRAATGQSSSYTYDKLNRKTSETLHGITSNYTYDKAGNLATLVNGSGTTTYTYDDIGRISKVTSPTTTAGVNDDTTFGYTDPTGPTDTAAATMTLPGANGGTVKRSTDTSGKLKQVIVKDVGGTQTLKQTFTYQGDADDAPGTPNAEQSLLSAKSLEIGGAGTTPDGKAYEYTSAGQVAKVITTVGASTTNTTTYTYDNAGNRTGRVKTPTSGSPTTTTYKYNADNQLCWQYTGSSANACGTAPAGATTYTYDKAGNQITGGFTGSWDAKGRIDGFNGAFAEILSPTNNEIIRLASGSFFENTILGVQRITEAGNVSQITRSPDGAAVSQIRDGLKRWFVTDHLGSTIALVDSTGAVKRSYDYDIDGNASTVAYGTGTNPETWIKYAGGHDVGGGLYHFGARYYQPSSARWTQMDPLLQPGDLGQSNRYTYVGSDPVNATDPQGLIAQCSRTGAGSAPKCPNPNRKSVEKPSVPSLGTSGKGREACIATGTATGSAIGYKGGEEGVPIIGGGYGAIAGGFVGTIAGIVSC